MRRFLGSALSLAVLLLLPLTLAFGQAIPQSPDAGVVMFGNAGAAITINDNGSATPYPSQITVSGVTPATVTKVQVILNGFSHTFRTTWM